MYVVKDQDEEPVKTVWTGPVGATYASPVRHQDKIYVISRGLLTVVDANSGKPVNKQRIGGARRVGNNRFGSLDYASPVIAGDRLFWLNPSGQVFVFQLGQEVKQVASNVLSSEKDEVFWGTPAISQDRMLIRSSKAIYCLTGSK